MRHIATFMDTDHAYLDMLLTAFLSETQDPARAAELFYVFETRLVAHMKIEEGILFPRFNQFTGFEEHDGPVVRLRRDHEVIKELLALVASGCAQQDMQTISQSSMRLSRALQKHHEREKAVQYPVSDRFILSEEWSDIVTRVYGVPTASRA